MSSTATIAPVNPMSAEGKDTVLNVMRRDRENFTRRTRFLLAREAGTKLPACAISAISPARAPAA